MLQSLRIKNLALIDDLTWELDPNLNILTGETGAGKSILIDAFNLLLGERADKTLVRDGADQCVVEGAIHIDCDKDINAILEEYGLELCQGGELLLKRAFTTQKQNRQFINGSPTTLQVLKKIGDRLVDMHGPHDHQSLLSVDSQLKALDAFGKLEEQRKQYACLYHEYINNKRELGQLNNTEQGDIQQQVGFLEYQIKEIEEAALNEQEEEKIDQEYRVASHGQRIIELAGSIQQLLSEKDQNIFDSLAQVQKLLQEWSSIDSEVENLEELNAGAIAQLQELQQEIERLSSKTELDTAQLQQLERRLDVIQSLKRKYGGSVSVVLQRLEELRKQRDGLTGREERIKELQQLIEKQEKELLALAKELSKQRKVAAPQLGKVITKQLKDLGFKQSNFEVEINQGDELRNDGQDKVEFVFAPNPGESARPLRAIASSGEMARVMLAIKTVLAAKDQVPILIFDEIDANVGGETAVAVGKRLRDLGESHQVLCITHLPQVAAAGHQHYRVEKKVASGRTVTDLKMLEQEDRLDELARMLGGGDETARKLASSLLERFE